MLRVHADVSGDFLDEYEDYGRADDPVLDFVVEQRRPIDSTRVVSPSRWASSGARSAIGVGGYFHSMEAPIECAQHLFGLLGDGRGKYPDFKNDQIVKCGNCDGKGQFLTINGQDILRFVRDFKNSPDIDKEI